MLRSITIIVIALGCSLAAAAQTFVLQGKVTDKENGNAVAGASVFLSNTSIGTAANAKGEFVLHNVPTGKFDLVISSLGYETYVVTINAQQAGQPLTIQLKPKANELASVVVGTYDKDGWTKWGKTFTDDFIGASFNAASCSIKNYGILKFRYSKRKNYLEAFADEPLVIENKALGYTIHYKLENFYHDFDKNTLGYEGFPLFEPMSGNNRKQKRWREKRLDAYYGSEMHFMRCLYRNLLSENGFEMRRVEKKPNIEKQRVQALYKYLSGADQNIDFESRLPKDSLDYYQKILRQPSVTTILYNTLLPGDSVAYGQDSVTAALYFKDYLQIVYKKKKEPYEYTSKQMTPDSPSGFITSLTTLINNRPVFVAYNGAFYMPQDMLTSGYWAWSEKVCNMLPFDYWP